MKYKITKFTEEEKQDILERYGEWMKPENTTWVEKEYRNALSDILTHEIGASGVIEINKYIKKPPHKIHCGAVLIFLLLCG